MNAILAFLGLRGTIAAGIALAFAMLAGVQTARLWKLQAASAESAGQLAQARDALSGWQAVAAANERQRKAAEAARRRQQEQAAAALAAAEAETRRAEAALADFRGRWSTRPPSCAIALTQMEAACAGSLSDY